MALITRSDDERLKCPEDNSITIAASLRAALARAEAAEAKLCRAMEAVAYWKKDISNECRHRELAEEIDMILSSSTPCSHELAEKRLQGILDRWDETLRGVQDERDRLKKAVEWACEGPGCSGTAGYPRQDTALATCWTLPGGFQADLRSRAAG